MTMTMTMTMTITHGEGHGEGGHILEEVDRGLEDHSESNLESFFFMMMTMMMMMMMMNLSCSQHGVAQVALQGVLVPLGWSAE